MFWKNWKIICFSYYYAGKTGKSETVKVYFLILGFKPRKKYISLFSE